MPAVAGTALLALAVGMIYKTVKQQRQFVEWEEVEAYIPKTDEAQWLFFRKLCNQWWDEAITEMENNRSMDVGLSSLRSANNSSDELTVDQVEPRSGGSHPVLGCHDDRLENLKPAHGILQQ